MKRIFENQLVINPFMKTQDINDWQFCYWFLAIKKSQQFQKTLIPPFKSQNMYYKVISPIDQTKTKRT